MQILAKSVGRRKEAVAQVQIRRGTGQFIINNKPAQEYLQNDACSLISVKAPFEFLLMSTSKSTDNGSINKDSLITPSPVGGLGLGPIIPSRELEVKTQRGIRPMVSASMLTGEGLELSIDTIVKVKGGGLMGQADAIRLGIARALCLFASNEKTSLGISSLNNSTSETVDQTAGSVANGPFVTTNSNEDKGLGETIIYSLDVRKQLKDKGYLTQDSRVKERRKYGLKKARKASQYHKR